MNFNRICKWLGRAFHRVVSLAGILLMGNLLAAQNSNILYMVTLSPDANRVAIAKRQESTGWELFEGALQQSFRKLHLPLGQLADSSIAYSPDGKSLLFTTVSERSTMALQAGKTEQANVQSTTLWQQYIAGDGESAAQEILARALPMSNILPLMNGSLVFMSKVEEVKSHSWSPITGGNRVWSTYKWMLRKPDGTVNAINSRVYAFFSRASLIRDEAVFVMQERYVDRQPSNPRQYFLDVTELRSGADLSMLERLGNMQDRRGGPRLQCDWTGKTCARLMAFDKDGYYAHQLELTRDGKVCKVEGLPDRLEQMDISRSGNAVALITRPTPRKNIGYKLAYVPINADGCAGDKFFFELP
ncbi:hypothetical protein [Rhodoferax sp.]|uniref:hypothetical protein n=1 Tax=Rhodoferax sp. TaxID=50421 RepID=UPI001EBF52C3|nr:hypothetical protein [Rhodoferax sp.]MBT9508244.1 hypothetical protein [Rhodoferax sp.]